MKVSFLWNLKQNEWASRWKGHQYPLSTSCAPGSMLGNSPCVSSSYNTLARKILTSPSLTEQETSPEILRNFLKITQLGTSLVVQWLRIRLPKKKKESACQYRRHRFNSWSRKIPHTSGQLSPCAATTKPTVWGPRCTTGDATTVRSPHTTTRETPLTTARESPHTAVKTQIVSDRTWICEFMPTSVHGTESQDEEAKGLQSSSGHPLSSWAALDKAYGHPAHLSHSCCQG